MCSIYKRYINIHIYIDTHKYLYLHIAIYTLHHTTHDTCLQVIRINKKWQNGMDKIEK